VLALEPGGIRALLFLLGSNLIWKGEMETPSFRMLITFLWSANMNTRILFFGCLLLLVSCLVMNYFLFGRAKRKVDRNANCNMVVNSD
jgi:hypothetical protein